MKAIITAIILQGVGVGVLAQDQVPEDRNQIILANGQHNSIDISGATQDGATYIFKSVTIERNGWLVMHPFKDGKPVGTIYEGHTYVKAGTTKNVQITVAPKPKSGANYIVMLHYDMNDDGVFDFNDGITVPDVPVFEGKTMIAHRFVSPQ